MTAPRGRWRWWPGTRRRPTPATPPAPPRPPRRCSARLPGTPVGSVCASCGPPARQIWSGLPRRDGLAGRSRRRESAQVLGQDRLVGRPDIEAVHGSSPPMQGGAGQREQSPLQPYPTDPLEAVGYRRGRPGRPRGIGGVRILDDPQSGPGGLRTRGSQFRLGWDVSRGGGPPLAPAGPKRSRAMATRQLRSPNCWPNSVAAAPTCATTATSTPRASPSVPACTLPASGHGG
jgi:hypothetical protein